MQYGVYSASEWIYPDGTLTDAKTLTLEAARGGRIGFQLKLTGLAAGETIRISRPLGSPLSMEAFRLKDVNVNLNTGRVGFVWKEEDGEPEYVTRRAPFRVYDVCRPYRAGAETASGTGDDAFYFCFTVPAETVPGTLSETLTVEADGVRTEVCVTVRVWSAVIPAAETLDVTNWFSVSNMASRHHLKPWSEEHWEMIRRYGALMRRARQTCFWVTKDLIGITKENGEYRFDFSRAKRLISMYLDMGFSVIEGTQIAYRRDWNEPVFYTYDGTEELQASSIPGYVFLSRYLQAWREFLRENGWLDLLIQHVADEPHDKSKDDYYRLSSIVRQFLPGTQIIEAVEIPDLNGAVDIWVPKDHYYESHKEQYEAFRAAGNTIWFYTCCFPGGHFLNRLLDKPLIEVRYLHWGNFKYRMPGFLHWGLNHYYDFQDPFECTAPKHGNNPSTLPAGDTNIVYPGDDGPWGSMRLENHCFGAQDYELFSLLAERNESLAQEIVDSMVRAFDDVEYDPACMERARVRLLTALNATD